MLASFRKMPHQQVLHLNLMGDCIALFVGSFVAAKPVSTPGIHWMIALGMATGSMLAWTLLGRTLRHYDAANGRGQAGDAALTTLQMLVLLSVLGLLRYLVPHYAVSSSLARFAAVVVPLVFWMRLTMGLLRHREVTVEHVLIVGIGPLGRHTGLELETDHREVLGYLRFSGEQPHPRIPAPLMGSVVNLEECIKRHVLTEVYIAGDETGNVGSQHAEMQECIRICERFGTPFALPAGRFRFARAQPVTPDAFGDGYIHYVSVRNKPFQRALKRLFDIAASAVALTALLPAMVVIAALVKLTSRGPILFKQARTGLHGRPFNMLKFRSMVSDAEARKAELWTQNEQSGPVFKLENDPRVTRLGRFLGKYSIDELPQLINVMRGEMTIVGPRPPMPSEVLQYEAWQRRRLSVRPGLTCVWQVSGRNQISFEDWMYLDMQYIDHWSLAQDFELILRTVPVVLTGRGAS